MQEIYSLSATKLIKKIKTKKLSVTEVSSAFINRIEQVNPSLNAVLQFDPERILNDAKIADSIISSGIKINKLHGLPITIKDACHVKNFIVSKGCPGLFKTPSTYDSTVVARLKAAGAIILGLTNTPELLLSYESDNLIYGRTNNPYDLTRTPGGSSGGEAAIIAAGGSPAGIGSDAGGSIRQPAHYCGICAHKPTQGLVPLTGNFPLDSAGIGSHLLTMGPMARNVEDLILLMSVISGTDQIDPNAPPVIFKKTIPVNLKSLRIAYFFNNPTDTPPCHDTVKAMSNVIELLRNEFFSVTKDYPELLNSVYRLHLETFMFAGDGGQSIRQLFAKLKQDHISPLSESFLNLASQYKFSVTELRQRLIEVEQFRYGMLRYMENYDIIISPVTATPAHFHGETFANIRDVGYAIAHNLTGWPVTVVPCGYANNGLPIGIQIIAKPWHDHVCLAVAMKIQKTLGVFPIPYIK